MVRSAIDSRSVNFLFSKAPIHRVRKRYG